MDKLIEEGKYLVKDLVQGDDTIVNNAIYQSLSYEEIQQALQLILNNPNLSSSKKYQMINNLWMINYEVKPPTMAEFLTPKYIGSVGDKIYDHVHDVLSSFMDRESGKRVLVLSTCIGFGKSSLSTLLVLYILLNLNYMRNPKRFFNLNDMGSLVATLLSFTQKKANQLLMQPFINILKASPLFHQTRTEDGIAKKQQELPKGHIAYSTAGRMGGLQLSKDLHITVVSDKAELLGLNIVAGIASEISFFLQKGISIEEIWQTYSDLRERINSRFSHAYLTATILDSSPLDIEASPIDKWIYSGEAEKDPEVMLVNAKHWDVFPEKYPIYNKTKETFPIFRGNAAKEPYVIKSELDKKKHSSEEIYEIPIDVELTFPQNLKKNIADYCAFPSGGMSKLFENFNDIDSMFLDGLSNIYEPIQIPEEKSPDELIWNHVKDQLFVKIQNRYEYWRNPKEKRFIHIDLSETGDISSISMSHPELNTNGEKMIIHDFNIPLHKGGTRINIDAVCSFVIDLRDKGHLTIEKVTADQYQSAAILQRLRRAGFTAEKFSVDRDTAPYYLYISEIKGGRVKAGKSIHLKNNLRSLIEYTRDSGTKKIEHIQGQPIYEDSGNWETSNVGLRAKDVSDTACGSAYPIITEYVEIPRYVFKEEELNDKNNGEKSVINICERFGLTTT